MFFLFFDCLLNIFFFNIFELTYILKKTCQEEPKQNWYKTRENVKLNGQEKVFQHTKFILVQASHEN